MTSVPLTYWDYVKLDDIRNLQSERQTECYDEVMFIAVHQHFEFWFAQVIRDIREIIRRLSLTPPEIAAATDLLHRCNIEFALATQGFEVMKTLARESFLAFRGALQHTSGLQSAQLTVIELLVGRPPDTLYHHLIDGPGMRDFLAQYGGPDGLIAQVIREVERTGTLRRAYERINERINERMTAAPPTAPALLSRLQRELVALDRQLADWRRRHAETAAKVLGRDYGESAGTVGNARSCRDNLEIGKRHTQRYFADLDPESGAQATPSDAFTGDHRMTTTRIATDQAPAAIGPYAQAARVGDFLFTSGQIPLDPVTMDIVGDDVATQTRQVLANLAAVLRAAGGDLSSVVKTTVFLKDMNDFQAMNEVYATFFPSAPPARSTVEVARLPRDARVEIECIAALPSRADE
ncbi:MAG: hypothetical protein CFK52_09755 [Chloracidobacterium sp. CP2_5A]|nr:MAG: hypothetical protein CFK52_09755 [Chloracidobacterium sp. CP2_5A]